MENYLFVCIIMLQCNTCMLLIFIVQIIIIIILICKENYNMLHFQLNYILVRCRASGERSTRC